jgi:CRISP-associated protein Cas1
MISSNSISPRRRRRAKPLIPARMVNEFVYCPRLAYLMWAQGERAETGDTAEGHRAARHAR